MPLCVLYLSFFFLRSALHMNSAADSRERGRLRRTSTAGGAGACRKHEHINDVNNMHRPQQQRTRGVGP